MRRLYKSFPFFFLFLFAQIVHGECSCSQEQTANWMGIHKEEIGFISLKNLAIPGTHDSATSAITAESPYASSIALPEWLQKLSGFWMDKFGSSLTKEITARWSKVQGGSIFEQLLDGIRFFNLHFCLNEEDGGVYSYHGLISDPILNVLKEIKEFSEAHPDEIIILDFHKLLDLDEIQLLGLCQAISSYFGSLLVPNTYDANVSLNELWDTPHRIIALTKNSAITQEFPEFWQGTKLTRAWINTTDKEKLEIGLTEKLKNRHPKDPRLFVTEGIFTINSDTVIDGIIGNPFSRKKAPDSNEEMAEIVHPIVIELLDKWESEGLINNMNILMVDWYDKSDIVEKVINLNLVH